MFNYIDKDGNKCEYKGTTIQEDNFKDTLEYNGGVYFEPKETIEVKVKEEKTEDKELEVVTDELEIYKKKLKEAGIKGRQLMSDIERAKTKCEELGLL